MTTKQLTLHHRTRLVVQVLVEDDTGVLAFSILLTTRLFTLFWIFSRFFTSILDELREMHCDLKAAFDFTSKVVAIVLASLAFGSGVTR